MKYTYIFRVVISYIVKFYYFLVVLTLCPSFIFAQQKKINDPKLTQRIDSLITIIQNANSIEEKTEIEQEVYNLSKSIGYNKGLMMGKLSLIRELINSGEYDQAVKLIDDHMDEALQLDVPSYVIKLLTLKADCYSSLGLFKESRTMLKQAKSEALKLKDNNAYHSALGAISTAIGWNIEAANGNLDSILFYYKNGSEQLTKLTVKPKTNANLFFVLNRIGLTYFKKNQYDSAKKYLPFIYQIKKEDKMRDKRIVLISYMTDACLSYIGKDYQKSLIACQNALTLSKSLKLLVYQKYIYQGLVQIYHKLGDHKKETVFLEKYVEFTDSLNLVEKKKMRQPLENIIENKNVGARNTDWNLYISIITALTILIVCSVLFNHYKKRNVGHLGVSVPEKAPHTLSPDQKENPLNELAELAKQNSSILYTRFNELDPTFCKRLLAIAPDLLITEQELAIYIRLNFDTKEIAIHTKSSVKAIQAKKYRLRKKLSIPTKEDLTNWIINF